MVVWLGLCAVLLLSGVSSASTIPTGTELPVRLRTEVGSRSRVGSPVEAVVIAGPAVGAVVRGVVADAERKSKPEGRAILQLQFRELATSTAAVPIEAKVSAVDNARETVDDDGVILGLRPLHARPSKIEDVLILAAHAHPAVLALMEGMRLVLSRALRPEIEYRAGVEMRLVLTQAVEFNPPPRTKIAALADSAQLRAIVDAQPVRTMAAHPPDPSDLTNLLFVGEADALRAAFSAAGWTHADATTLRTAVETFLAVADRHSYRHAPVSVLLLDGAKADLVFEKQNNTFAKRHHVRIWRRPESWTGRAVWVGAATHDIGIVFSREAREFTHRVESNVDLERDKVADDLCFAGAVTARGLVPRPLAPRTFVNATGDSLSTDGAMTVLIMETAERMAGKR